MVRALIIDPVENNLYFSNYFGRKIERINVDGTGRITLIDTYDYAYKLAADLRNR